MLIQAAAALDIDLAQSWMVGDRWRDIDCGQRAGVRTVFIDFGYAEQLHAAPDFTVGRPICDRKSGALMPAAHTTICAG